MAVYLVKGYFNLTARCIWKFCTVSGTGYKGKVVVCKYMCCKYLLLTYLLPYIWQETGIYSDIPVLIIYILLKHINNESNNLEHKLVINNITTSSIWPLISMYI